MSLGRLKGQRTRLVKRIGETLAEGETLLSTDCSTFVPATFQEDVKSQIALLRELQDRYESLSEKIGEAAGDTEESIQDGEESMETILQISKVIAKLGSRLEAVQLAPKAKSVEDGSTTSIENQLQKLIDLETARSQRQSVQTNVVNLPKLDFLPFYGDVLKWNEFWDSFSAAVDNNACLAPVQKLTYLLSKLRGEAKAVVSGFQTTEENYHIVVELLRQRFGDQQTAITTHYSKIMELPSSPNHTERLRGLYDELEQHLRCLAALGEDIDHRHFISLIMTNLPRDVITRLEEIKGPDECWTVQSLRSKLRNHLGARETADRQSMKSHHQIEKTSPLQTTSSQLQHNGHTNGRSNHWKGKESAQRSDYRHHDSRTSKTTWVPESRHRYGTAETLYASEKHKNNTKTATCAFCNGCHWSDECRKFSTVDTRKKRLMQEDRCLNCLRNGHRLRSCLSNRPCYYCKKVKNHHSSLCYARFTKEKESVQVVAEPEESEVVDESLLASGERALLQTALVKAVSRGSTERKAIRLLFDSGSHRSYISQEAVKKLNLRSQGSETISVNTFGATKSKSVKTQIVEISLEMEDKSIVKIVGNVVPTISGSIRRQRLDLSKYNKILRGLRLADTIPKQQEDTTIDILIGSDYYMDLLTFEKKEIGDGLHLLGSKFGWILTGRLPTETKSSKDVSMLILNITNQSRPELSRCQPIDKSMNINPSTEDYWNLETIGIRDQDVDISDEEAIKSFNENVRYSQDRYMVKWPWKEKFPNLPSNFALALGRLKSLVHRLSQSPEMKKQYNNIIQDQLSKDVIEKIDDNNSKNLVHYIPHQAVCTPQKTTTKVRVVYDASAKTRKESLSLNECLLRGPVILENLCGLLMRFRLHRIGVVADIEKAFLQVGLQEQDRDVVRFLWLKDPSKDYTEKNVQIYRFCRVPFGVISSPFLLSATVQHHLKQAKTTTADHISQHIHVDNVITGVATTEEAQQLYEAGKQLFEGASMNLREWTSNCKVFAKSVSEKDKCADRYTKVLGMIWDVETDQFSYKYGCSDISPKKLTKRQVFQEVSKVFDPLGLITPALMRGKLHLQEMWSEGLKWDDELSKEQADKWKGLRKDLAALKDLKIPRFGGFESKTTESLPSLLCFCDASAKAYASCIYLHWCDTKGKGHTQLMFAKSRLAPIKRQTIPRLELLAVLIGVRALQFVEDHLKLALTGKYLWSDSQCVLHWIQAEKLQPVFVQNRLNEIKSHKDVSFRYVKSEENPADFPSRGTTVADLMNCSLWWNGPAWLKSNYDSWPYYNMMSTSTDNNPKTAPTVLFEASLLSPDSSAVQCSPFGIDATTFSRLYKLLRVTAWCQRFVCKARMLPKESVKYLSSEEVSQARKEWEKAIQRTHFTSVFEAISSRRRNELASKLDLNVDSEGLLRCGGRLQHTDLVTGAKFPKLLPKNNHFTTLMIEDVHRKLCHAGVSHTLTELRQQYWIPEGRRQVQKTILRCSVCRRFEGGPYKVPPMPSFPPSRVAEAIPFSYTGLDYFGPLYVKSDRLRSKVWCCLFTCMTTRAIHLELVSDLSIEEFLLSFRRFVARRGSPQKLFCDNATNFHAATDVVSAVWKDVFHDPDVHSYFATTGIEWKFLPQSAPWMGGYYERLIGVVKRSLRKTLGKLCWTSVQLQTLLAEVEAVVNSRPLIYVGTDLASGNPLTPRHFLSLNPNVRYPSSGPSRSDFNDSDYLPKLSSHDILLQSWTKGQRHLNHFWNVWRNNYITSLRERSQRLLKQPRSLYSHSPQVDDIVLIKDDILPRGSWKLAKIKELILSADQQCRAARLCLPSRKETIRPLALLYPLECSEEHCAAVKESDSNPPLCQGDISSMPLRKPSYHMSRVQPHQQTEPTARENASDQFHLQTGTMERAIVSCAAVSINPTSHCFSSKSCDLSQDTQKSAKDSLTDHTTADAIKTDRMQRKAAINAKAKMQQWVENER